MTMNYLYNQKKKTLKYFHLGKKIPQRYYWVKGKAQF